LSLKQQVGGVIIQLRPDIVPKTAGGLSYQGAKMKQWLVKGFIKIYVKKCSVFSTASEHNIPYFAVVMLVVRKINPARCDDSICIVIVILKC